MNKVKELREKKGMKQAELAQALEVSQGTLSNWERGVHNPDNKALGQLAKIFECSVDYLLGHSEIRKPLNDLYMRVMQDAKDSGMSPRDLEIAVDFWKQAKERDDDIAKKS
ncbi:MAG: helix-turn-helix domain-containing protein [Defluviitaleaceae bacterium]|nr:helix-turn-helix domain-containing protein [Defluviitaleaceae bacterium]